MENDIKRNYQLYGRNDMIMLDEHNKIYGSLGMAEPYVLNTVEGNLVTMNSPKEGQFDDVITDFHIMGKSTQRTTTGAQLFDVSLVNPEVVYVNGVQRDSILIVEGAIKFTSSSDGDVYISNIQGDLSSIIQVDVEEDTQYTITISDNRLQKSMIRYIDSENEFIGTFFRIETQYTFTTPEKCVKIALRLGDENSISGTQYETRVMLNKGSSALPWEPYTGGQPSPSPDYPQEIKSVGDSGTVNVTLSDGGSQSQSLPVQTPSGLPGIPVSSGGNYTDESGQQWICDEIDFKRGVYVQRINEFLLTGNLKWVYDRTVNNNNNFHIRNGTSGFPLAAVSKPCICNYLPFVNHMYDDNEVNLPKIYANNVEITISFPPDSEYNSLDAWKTFLNNVGDCKIYYILGTPIETDLSEEQLFAYQSLHTNYPTTMVMNDDGAWMKVTYKQIENGG